MTRAFVLLSLLLLGCDGGIPTKRLVPTSNAKVSLQLLFEVDGCKVYRFEDGYWHYFTTCEGSVNTEWTEHVGKTTHHRNDEIQTHRKDPQ